MATLEDIFTGKEPWYNHYKLKTAAEWSSEFVMPRHIINNYVAMGLKQRRYRQDLSKKLIHFTDLMDFTVNKGYWNELFLMESYKKMYSAEIKDIPAWLNPDLRNNVSGWNALLGTNISRYFAEGLEYSVEKNNKYIDGYDLYTFFISRNKNIIKRLEKIMFKGIRFYQKQMKIKSMHRLFHKFLRNNPHSTFKDWTSNGFEKYVYYYNPLHLRLAGLDKEAINRFNISYGLITAERIAKYEFSKLRRHGMDNIAYEDIFNSAVIGVLKAQQQGFNFMWKTTSYLIRYYIILEVHRDYKDSLLIKPIGKDYENLQRYLTRIDKQRINIGEELSIKKHLEIGMNFDSDMQEAYGIVTGVEQMSEEFLNNLPDASIDILMEIENASELVHNVIFKSLSERELEIIKLRFGFYGQEYSLKEIGKKLQHPISGERVRHIQEKVFANKRREIENIINS